MAVEITLLGEITGRVNERVVDLGPSRQRCVLVALAVDAGQVVPADRLVGRVWGADPPRRGRTALQSHISRLRGVFDGALAIVHRSDGYVLEVEQPEQAVDLLRFRALRGQARGAGEDTQKVALLTEALALWRGEPLTGLSGEWVDGERDRWGQERWAAEQDLVDAQLRLGQGEELVAQLSARTSRHPLDERVAGQYMLALHRAGRSADALDHYQRLRERLVDELGTDPGTALQDLHRQILTADPRLLPTAADTMTEPVVTPRQLPAAPTRFIGRRGELDRLDAATSEAVPGSRMMLISTIGGAAGIGKTWLALTWAHRNLDRFPDGQLFADLHGFGPTGQPAHPADVLARFLDALGIDRDRQPTDPDHRSELYRSLVADKRMLIVLDNAATTDQVTPLLPGSPHCTVLVTSRNHLRGLVARHGAHPIHLDVLTDPEAHTLLTAALGPERTTADAEAVAELIQLCGGLPLALGLIAARITADPHLPLTDVVTELHALGPDALDSDDPTVLSPGLTPGTAEPEAIAYLATETLRYWRIQAKDRRITTPSPAAVRWSWASDEVAVPAQELQPGESPPRLLTSGVVTELREQLYERLDDPHGRIVVLGDPGAGKTTAMLLLLIDILEHRPPESDQPVPVWLSLGGWNPQTSSLRHWAAATLARDHPGLSAPAHGGKGTAAELIRTGRVALFLDGLDEMPPAVQAEALTSLDRDATGLKIVLTSRSDEYRAALTGGRLYGAAVIDVLPVDVEDATGFLLAEQLGQHRHAWQQVTDHLRDHPGSVAARTLTTPLALSLARDTFTDGGNTPADLLDADLHPNPDALRQYLLACALTLAYRDKAERAHATQWLSWIAQHLGTDRDLQWWDIPTWTPQWQLRLVGGLGAGLAVGLATGLAYGLVGGFAVGLTNGLAVGFAYGLAFGLTGRPAGVLAGALAVGLAVGFATAQANGPFFGLAFGLTNALAFELAAGRGWGSTPRALAARWPTRRDLPRLLAVGLAVGLAFGIAFGLAFGIVYGLVAGPFFGLAVGLFRLWSTPLATAHAVGPLDVYRSDRRRAVTYGSFVGLTAGLTAGLVFGLDYGLAVGFFLGLAVGLFFGLAVGLGPALQLMLVQMIWWMRGRRVRFVPLLQTALHKQILRQAGAIYQFRHGALQDFLQSRDARA